MRNLKFEDIPKATEEILQKLNLLEKEICSLKENLQPKVPEEQFELLTRKETADFLRISLPTLYHWTKGGVLKSYGLGNRVYYKKSEVEARLIGVN